MRAVDKGVAPILMSPEAVALEPPGPGVDLWGLAVTLYEGLTGRNPFSAPTVGEVVCLILQGAIQDPRDTRPDCPASLAEFFASALAADRRRRPKSAAELLHQLRALTASSGPA
jgi:serine/threonine protein kinase